MRASKHLQDVSSPPWHDAQDLRACSCSQARARFKVHNILFFHLFPTVLRGLLIINE